MASPPPPRGAPALPRGATLQILIVDCYDSFTFNLVQLVQECATLPPFVVHPDTPFAEVEALLPLCDGIVLGPGPGRPECEADFGICARLLLQDDIPVLGVCLGLQGLAHVMGGKIVHASVPMHGRLATIVQTAPEAAALAPKDTLLFRGLPASFLMVLYNSLVACPDSLPPSLRCTATSAESGHIMALEYTSPNPSRFVHKHAVQFHPESICSQPHGRVIIENFLNHACRPPRCRRDDVADAAAVKASTHAVENISTVPPHLSETVPASAAVHLTPLVAALDFVDSAAAFDALFAGGDASFWLDSSRVAPGFSRFAFMGDGAGSLARQFHFRCADRSLHTFARAPLTLGVAESEAASDSARVGWTRVGHVSLPDSEDFFDEVQSVIDAFILDAARSVHVSPSSESASLLDAPPPPFEFDFVGGLVGFLGYELRSETNPDRGKSPSAANARPASDAQRSAWASSSESAIQQHYADQPDACLMFVDRFLVFDYQLKKVHAISLVPTADRDSWSGALTWLNHVSARLLGISDSPSVSSVDAGASVSAATANHTDFHMHMDKTDYHHAIDACLQQIRDGESYELCLTNQFFSTARPDPCALFARLRASNPVPYAALLNFQWPSAAEQDNCNSASTTSTLSVVCSSPERFLTIDQHGTIESKPIKGTQPRGRDAAEDEALRAQLACSEKDRAENLMIVDLVRNDLGRVCDTGSVHVPRLMSIESYATVHQLVSTVAGRLRSDVRAAAAVRAAFPPGSMTGAPKVRAMRILEGLERAQPRGVYSGCLGWFSLAGGACDLAVVIRTAVVTRHGTSLGAGGAIVYQSSREEEFEEVLLKTKAVASAIAHVAGGGGSSVRMVGCPSPYAPPVSVIESSQK